MAREAEGWVGWEGEEEEGYGEEDREEEEWNGEMSPVDEEREVGELVEGWYEAQREGQDSNRIQGGLGAIPEQHTQNQNQDEDFMDAQFDFEDSDVEEVFMQVLSQQEQQQTQQSRDGSTIAQLGVGGEQNHILEVQDEGTWDAEMS